MSNKMLIDAVHPEETRVVVVRDKRVEDFDFEAASKKPLRGNIYLAKVTRVEPSLQAAFVEYGGNRHGFLAFSEIHPDYYQIPQADLQALLAEEAEDDEEPDEPPRSRRGRGRKSASQASKEADASESAEPAAETQAGESGEPDAPIAQEADAAAADDGATEADADANPTASDAAKASDDGPAPEATDEPLVAKGDDAPQKEAEDAAAAAASDADAAAAQPEGEAADEAGEKPAAKPRASRKRTRAKKSDTGLADPQVSDAAGDSEERDVEEADASDDEPVTVTEIGEQDALEEIPERRRRAPRRHYKIQEVIKRRQILLVQVVKEERGTKGAALTTYLSLAGRYSVLMPNTARGGGVSRKITDNADRKRLKSLVSELEVPEGMGIILRTAGASRTKTEIKRDFEYLLRLYESVRDLTLNSIAPQLVYEEGNLVKRSIRDLYNKEIDEVLVSGEAAYREAKDFMKMLMPSHAKNVKPYREATPIFTAYQVESQLDAMFSPQVTLPSKGYLVINPTEALISIDVNSGRSTKEVNIEETAFKTNMEAATEVARQLRLRDLAGLIVIDFIDMEDKRHNRQVEKRLKDALKLDRSRIQVGRISSFGLMEMSRQRTRQGMVETSMVTCEVCAGTGHVRSTQSVALYCLRALEEHLLKSADRHIVLKTSAAVALYILNQKRAHLNELEDRFGLEIGVDADETLSGQHMQILAGEIVERDADAPPPTAQIAPDAVSFDETDEAEDSDARGGERSGGRRRRRRRRRGNENGFDEADNEAVALPIPDELETKNAAPVDAADLSEDDDRRGKRRRGRRGGRRHRREGEVAAGGEDAQTIEIVDGAPAAALAGSTADGATENHSDASPKEAATDADVSAQAGEEKSDAAQDAVVDAAEETSTPSEAVTTDGPAARDSASASTNGAAAETQPEPETVETASGELDGTDAPAAEPAPEPEPERPRRVGWWRARSFFS